jgi:hypothetical protein
MKCYLTLTLPIISHFKIHFYPALLAFPMAVLQVALSINNAKNGTAISNLPRHSGFQ